MGGTYNICLVIRIDILRNDTEGPDGRYPDLRALGVVEKGLEEFEEALQMRLEALDNVLENGVEDVDADFAVDSLL